MPQIVRQEIASDTTGGKPCAGGCSHRFEPGEPIYAVQSEDNIFMGWYCRRCILEWGIRNCQYYDLPGFERYGVLIPRTVPSELAVRMLAALVSYSQGVKSVDHQLRRYRVVAEAAIKPQHVETYIQEAPDSGQKNR